MCREPGTARSAGEVASSARRHAPSKSGIRTCSTRCPRRAQFRRGPFVMSGGLCTRVIASRESGLSFLPRRRAVGARGSSVGGSAARRWRRRHLLREAAASDRPPTVRPASGGGMFGAHGKIAYLSLPFCALMRQHGRLLRLGLRHRRSDPIVITDRSSSLCVHGPPGSIRWAELVCGRFSAAPTNSRRGGDTAPSYDSSVRRRTPRVHRNRRGTRTVVEGRASIVTSPGGTAAPGSWIHHVGVLNADRVLAPPATACAAGGGGVSWALLSGPSASSAISSTGYTAKRPQARHRSLGKA